MSFGSPGALRKRIIDSVPARLKAIARLLPTKKIIMDKIDGSITTVTTKFCAYCRLLVAM